MTTGYETILADRNGPMATLSLNRPDKRNSIGGPMMAELYAALRDIADDRSVRVLVLRGAGADFCPGADVKHYGSGEARRRAPPGQGSANSMSRRCCTRCRP